MNASVILQDLTIGYQAKGNNKVVASGLNATIMQGELTCLLGRNGIGKSTLLRTLAGFQSPLDGLTPNPSPSERETLEGGSKDPIIIVPLSEGERLGVRPLLGGRQLSKLISVVLTEKPDVRNMTTEELVGMGRSPYTGFWGRLTKEDVRVVDEAMALVGIEGLRGRYVHTLSDGERQKVMIAKALAQQTPIIYLDEPTAFLDFPSKVEVMQLLYRLAHEQQKTIFLSTHDVELSLQMADRIWLMESDGLHVGTPRELADEGVLSRFIEHKGITFNADTLTIRVTK